MAVVQSAPDQSVPVLIRNTCVYLSYYPKSVHIGLVGLLRVVELDEVGHKAVAQRVQVQFGRQAGQVPHETEGPIEPTP